MSGFHGSANEIEILFEPQGGIPVFPSPRVIGFAKEEASLAMERAVPIQMHDAVFRASDLKGAPVGHVVDAELRQHGDRQIDETFFLIRERKNTPCVLDLHGAISTVTALKR